MFFRADDALDRVQTPFHRKILAPGPGGGPQVFVDFQAYPFNQLRLEDQLDTADLCRLFGASSRSVYRWIAEHGLQPAATVGRTYLFTVAEIRRWYRSSRPRPGRPAGQ